MRWFSRLSLLWKILLSTTVAVTLLFAFTGEIVLNAVTRTMYQSLQEEVQNSFQAYTSLWLSREDMLAKVTRVLAHMQEVRLAFGTGDQATISDTAGELWARVEEANAIFLVFDPFGKFVASLGGEMPRLLPATARFLTPRRRPSPAR